MVSDTNKLNFEDHDWTLAERVFDQHTNRTWETLFSLGNGTLGTRGSFDEGLPGFSTEGTYINGFYESFPLTYEEGFIGYASDGQRILTLANGKAIRIVFADGEVYDPLAPGSTISDYARTLDLRSGMLTRELTWTSASGQRLHLKAERLVSFTHPTLIAQRLTITPGGEGSLSITSLIDYQIYHEQSQEHDPRAATGHDRIKVVTDGAAHFEDHGDRGAILIQRPTVAPMAAACGLRDHFPDLADVPATPFDEPGAAIGHTYTVPAQPVVLEKYIAYATSSDPDPDKLRAQVRDELRQASFELLRQEQADYLAAFWGAADIQITAADPHLQGAIRLNMFHLLQSAGRDGYRSVPAKGLTGDGYDGHYFWDTESYMLPFFLHTAPDIARGLLEYRYHTLPRARQRAADLSQAGALFAWRTIGGDECSANYPTGTAQYHIDADIAFAVKRYYEITGDQDFMIRCGAELLFETARLWASLGAFVPSRGGKFCIHGVTGPDEYTTLVDNNTYTNLMARENLGCAAEIAGWLRRAHRAEYDRIAAGMHLDDGEPGRWKKAAKKMYIPDAVSIEVKPGKFKRIMPQDDTFLTRPAWDEAVLGELRGERPLLLRYHPLVYNRYQVCKQADLILAEFMFGQEFSDKQKRRDFNYYEARTTHDSSLSRCIFSIVAAELADPADPEDDYLAQAAEFYRASATIDLDNHRDETKKGIHAANMGGSWMGIVFGFGHLRASRDCLALRPVVPPGWDAYTFRVFYQGRRLQVQVERTAQRPKVTLALLSGDPLDVELYGKLRRVE